MKDIVFNVSAEEEVGGWVARWDDPKGGGITTQGDTLAELEAMVRDAVKGYFEDHAATDRPSRVQLHFAENPRLVLA